MLKTLLALALVVLPAAAIGKVVAVDVQAHEPWLAGKPFGKTGAYELVRGVVHYEISPADAEAKAIADIDLAPRNAHGMVEYSGPFLLLRPIDPARANGTTVIEIANRGGTQENGIFFVADQFDLPNPGTTKVDDSTPFDLGYTLAWVGWQARIPGGTFGLAVPVGSGHGPVRFAFVAEGDQVGTNTTTLETNEGGYCARDTDQRGATLRIKHRFDQPGQTVPPEQWHFAVRKDGGNVPDRCHLTVDAGFKAGDLYELTYRGENAAIVGLGPQAVRDFATAVRDGIGRDGVGRDGAVLPVRASDAKVLLAYGYSQSARFLRDFLYRGFNRRTDGKRVFDGTLIFAAGSGRGSFDHRYAMPGEAGNSVMSDLRPVDLYPFADEATPDIDGGPAHGLLDRARADGVVPAIMNVYSGSEYWARGGSLLHTTTDGQREVALAPESRLYVFSGSVHAPQPMNAYLKPESRAALPLNVNGDQFWAADALLEDMREWISANRAPPPSVYPRLGKTLVPPGQIRFPMLPGVEVPTTLPPIWRLDFGPDYAAKGIISREPPILGSRYPLLVPSVDADGNELGGWRGVMSSVPLGTFTAWNWPIPGYRSFGLLSQLGGALIPFMHDKAARLAAGDPRLSLAERYGDKAGYLRAVGIAFDQQVEARFALASQRADILDDAARGWERIEKYNAAHAPPK